MGVPDGVSVTLGVAVWVFVAVAVAVGVRVGVKLGVLVRVGVRVNVGLAVRVEVLACVLPSVAVFVGVLVGVRVGVRVRLGVRVGVRVARLNGVLVKPCVNNGAGVRVGKGVEVDTLAEAVGVWVMKGMAVWVGAAGERAKKTCIAKKMATPRRIKRAIPKIQMAVFI